MSKVQQVVVWACLISSIIVLGMLLALFSVHVYVEATKALETL